MNHNCFTCICCMVYGCRSCNLVATKFIYHFHTPSQMGHASSLAIFILYTALINAYLVWASAMCLLEIKFPACTVIVRIITALFWFKNSNSQFSITCTFRFYFDSIIFMKVIPAKNMSNIFSNNGQTLFSNKYCKVS